MNLINTNINILFWLRFFGLNLVLFVVNAEAQTKFKRACIQSNLNDILISWETVQDPCAKFQSIQIWARQSPFTPYVAIDSVLNPLQTHYTHLGAAAIGNNWNYYLVYRYRCDDTELIGDPFAIDLKQPDISDIDSVSYDPLSGKFIIGWKANTALDLMGYKVWKTNGSNNVPIDSTTALYYQDNSSNPMTGPGSYRISAYDSCINQSVISAMHRSVYLSFTGNICQNKNVLNWTPYQGSTTLRYDLYIKRKGDSDYSIDTSFVPPLTSLNYNISDGDSIEIFIRVHLSNGFTSRSNPIVLYTPPTQEIKPINCFKTIAWIKDKTLKISYYREVSFSGTDKAPVKTVRMYRMHLNQTGKRLMTSFTPGSISEAQLTDYMETDTSRYLYWQELIDSCDRIFYTDTVRNIVLDLRANEDDDITLNLNWNKSYMRSLTADQYLFRGEMEDPLNSLIYMGVDTFLSEPFSDTFNLQCYQVETYFRTDTNRSNPVCYIPHPVIHFPNAIHPNGVNRTFYPVGLGINKRESRIRIYSRTGQLVHDDNLLNPWNGTTLNGDVAHSQVFIYLAEIYFVNGTKENFKGNVTLLY